MSSFINYLAENRPVSTAISNAFQGLKDWWYGVPETEDQLEKLTASPDFSKHLAELTDNPEKREEFVSQVAEVVVKVQTKDPIIYLDRIAEVDPKLAKDIAQKALENLPEGDTRKVKLRGFAAKIMVGGMVANVIDKAARFGHLGSRV